MLLIGYSEARKMVLDQSVKPLITLVLVLCRISSDVNGSLGKGTKCVTQEVNELRNDAKGPDADVCEERSKKRPR